MIVLTLILSLQFIGCLPVFQYSREHLVRALRVVIQGDLLGVTSSTNMSVVATIMAPRCNCMDLVPG